VVIVPGYRSRGLCSIPGATRFSEKVVGVERGPLSLLSTIEELLERNSCGSGLENRDYGRKESAVLLRDTPLTANVGTNFADKRRSLGRYSSFMD
jgi:hypothetical protein